MTDFHVPLGPHTVHGVFDHALPPILTIQPGDSVTYRTLDAGWGSVGMAQPPATPIERPKGAGHALVGPIYVEGAHPGDVLAVRIDEVVPSAHGWTWAGPRPHLPRYNCGLTEEMTVEWEIDRLKGTASDRNGLGLTVPLHPFMGLMGNAPGEVGRHPTAPPRPVGGNIDCRALVAGSTLYLPVAVEGALFSTGDGHAAQGDGESSQTGIECPMDSVRMTFDVVRGVPRPWPVADTPEGFVTLGFAASLDDAASTALEIMLDHLEVTLTIPRQAALALASVAVNLHITQIVNGTVGVHAILPPDAVSRTRV